MGAALTYARRYALFTLVESGEDDLDAPDLAVQTIEPSPQTSPPATKTGSNGRLPPATTKTLQGPRKGGDRAAVLSGEASAILRDQLLAEIAGLETKDDLDAWTLRAWPKANTLAPADGDKVRQAFQAQLTQIQSTPDEGHHQPAELDPPAAKDEIRSRIDKSMLTLPETKRLRDKQHLRFVAKQPCLVCGREPCDPHHLRFAQSRGLGQRSATNSRSRCVGHTIANCTAPARSRTGGRDAAWKPLEFARRLWMTTYLNRRTRIVSVFKAAAEGEFDLAEYFR